MYGASIYTSFSTVSYIQLCFPVYVPIKELCYTRDARTISFAIIQSDEALLEQHDLTLVFKTRKNKMTRNSCYAKL